MVCTIAPDEKMKINLAPKNVVEEIIQNLTTLISTPKFSVPLDRNFGLLSRFVDKPTPVAEAMIVSEVLDALEMYEPRVEFKNITFERDEKRGKVIPLLEVDINAEG